MSLLERLERISGPVEDTRAAPGALVPLAEAPLETVAEVSEAERYYAVKHAVFEDVMEGVSDRAVNSRDEEKIKAEVDEILNAFAETRGLAITRNDRVRLLSEFVDEFLNMGPLESYLNDPTVSRIVVNGPEEIYIERLGKLELTETAFRDEEHILTIARRIAGVLKGRLDEGQPMLERKFPDGARVRLVIPPLARKGPTITIHKLARNPLLISKEDSKQQAQVAAEPFFALKNRIQERIIADIDPQLASGNDLERLRQQVESMIEAVTRDEGVVLSRSERSQLLSDVLNEMIGLGPIEPLVADPSVSEIMVNSPTQVYVERNGKLQLSDVKFRDNRHVLNVIEKIVAPLGRRVDEASPMVDARLKDGSRVNAIIPPLALKGPCLTIRKFSADPLSINDLIQFGSLTSEVAQFLQACVQARLNIVVSGGTGSGKTTLLNVLSSFIPDDERIITIEDAAELQLRQDHVVTLEARPPNIEGQGQVTIRDLVRNSLRMRPDRIVVGECRGGEALDMLQAMNTGHDGSLTTAHANSPREMLSRLETMVLMAGMDLPLRAIREQIAAAIDLIVQLSRLRDGSRKVEYVTEVVGMEGDIITLQDLFVFEQTGVNDEGKIQGRLKPTGIRPRCYERIVQSGARLPLDLFRV